MFGRLWTSSTLMPAASIARRVRAMRVPYSAFANARSRGTSAVSDAISLRGSGVILLISPRIAWALASTHEHRVFRVPTQRNRLIDPVLADRTAPGVGL